MLRMMAYGGESNFAYPPRPSDPKATWEPEWAVRVRVKSHTMAMLGQDLSESSAGHRPGRRAEAEEQMPTQGTDQPQPQPRLPTPGAILRGILGR
jgi:hypothetical protein